MKKNSRATNITDGIEIPCSGYTINGKGHIQNMVSIIEHVVEGNVSVVQSNCELVLVGFDDVMHQVQGTMTWAPRYHTICSSYINTLELLSPRAN